MSTEAYMIDNKYVGGRYKGLQDRDYWIVKIQQCTTQQNINSVYDNYIFVSRKGSEVKEVSHLLYWR